MDHKRPITVNGVPVSLQGHSHDFSTFPVLCAKMGKSATQNYSSNTTTKVIFNTSIFNNGLTVDTVNSRLRTPPTLSGIGIFDIQANLRLNLTSNMYIYFYVNGVLVETPYYMSTSMVMHIVSSMLQLTPDDYVEIFIRGGTARTLQTTCTFSMKQVA